MAAHARDLPSPPGWPLVGQLPAFARDPLGTLTAASRVHGDRVHARLGSVDLVLLSHPADIEWALVKLKGKTRKDRVTQRLRGLLGDGLLTAEGPPWRRHRRLAAPSFQRSHIQSYADIFVSATRSWVEQLPGRSRRDVHQDFTAVTLEIVVRALFGTDEAPDAAAVGGLVDVFSHELAVEMFTPRWMLPTRIPTPGRRRMQRAGEALDALLRPLIDARRRSGATGADLLSRLVAARDDDGAAFDDQQLRDEVVTLFLAGHETTALTLSYAAWLLATHPEVAAALQAEVDAACPSADPTLGCLEALPLAGAVVSEALRLYPPAWIIGRELTEDVELDGVTIPRGWELSASQWVVHRDPRWYRDPDAFRPQRWLSGELDDLPRFASFPFGGGPRVCIGNHFARMEAILCLATAARHLDLRGIPGARLDLDPSITLRPRGGVWMDVARRARKTP